MLCLRSLSALPSAAPSLSFSLSPSPSPSSSSPSSPSSPSPSSSCLSLSSWGAQSRSLHTSLASTTGRSFNKRKPSDHRVWGDMKQFFQKELRKPRVWFPNQPVETVTYMPPVEDDEVVHEEIPRKDQYEYVSTLPNNKTLWLGRIVPNSIVPHANEGTVTTEGGSRKRARALVMIRNGTGIVTVNHRPITEYFGSMFTRGRALEPIIAAELMGVVDVNIHVKGGGFNGQAVAISHGLAKCLVKRDPEYRYMFRENGMMRKDIRVKERKHTGKKKARKKQQWVKR
eukprot:TRINITY_DN159_c0_g2_i1.p1 TRINITY_DN159_c0_g2~~TRINITY_DN159_c0_g2_i1.p1  ORF type:complete len:285 (+),score=86.87 TRINITY_DN159_c0_g2_i1:105-959(+)